MKKSWFTEEQVIYALRLAESGPGSGSPPAVSTNRLTDSLCRVSGRTLSRSTLYSASTTSWLGSCPECSSNARGFSGIAVTGEQGVRAGAATGYRLDLHPFAD
jgi:hypothetical protein